MGSLGNHDTPQQTKKWEIDVTFDKKTFQPSISLISQQNPTNKNAVEMHLKVDQHSSKFHPKNQNLQLTSAYQSFMGF